MVAWNVKTNIRCSKIMPRMCQKFTPTKSTTHFIFTTSISMGRKPHQIYFTSRVRHICSVDYFSRYLEVVKLNNTTSKGVIEALKHIFAHHGIPEVLHSDNSPQYSSIGMKEFASAYGFEHITSSPHYPRSNGLAERTVKTIKTLMKKSTDLNCYYSVIIPLHFTGAPSVLLNC